MVQLAYSRLDDDINSPVELVAGTQIINAQKNSRLQGLTVNGRTLVDLLEGMGSGEYTQEYWSPQGIPLSNSTTQSRTSGKSLKFSSAQAPSFVYRNFATPLDPTKCYLFGAWVYVESYTAGSVQIGLGEFGSTIYKYQSLAATVPSYVGKWQFIYIKVPLSHALGASGFRATIGITSAGGCVAYFDEVRLYCITIDEYSAIGTKIAGENVDVAFPYVSFNGVNGLYIKRYGKNLLPSVPDTVHANAKINGSYDLTLMATSNYQGSEITIPALGSTKYVLKVEHNSLIEIAERDINGGGTVTDFATTGHTITLTTKPTTTSLLVRLTCQTTGTLFFRNWQLEFGNIATPFTPREDSLIAFSGIELHANPNDGSNPDILREANGRYEITRKWRKMTLDGSLAWGMLGNDTSFKTVQLSLNTPIKDTGYVTKFNGLLLTRVLQGGTISAADVQLVSDSTPPTFQRIIAITISNTDSGWGDSYTPSVDEIKAYFNGYQMGSVSGGTFTTPYVSGTKAWRYATGDNSTGTTTMPTTLNPGNAGWQPYQLLYRLATVTTETVQEYGSLSFIDGNNFVEVGNGYVSRERINPTYDGNGYYHINNKFSALLSPSKFKYPTERIEKIYANNSEARGVVIKYEINAYGKSDAHILSEDFDTNASYSASYIRGDVSKIANITGFLSTTEESQIRDLTDGITEALSRVSAVEAKKSERGIPVWIAPTLINGWSNFDQWWNDAGFYKDGYGVVRLKGLVKGGTINANVFTLPIGYRPKYSRVFSTIADDTTCRIDVRSDGTVAILLRGTSWVSFEGISFIAEQ